MYGIDREQISELVFFGLESPSYSVVPANDKTDWYRFDPPSELQYKHNLTKAIEILDKSYPDIGADGIRLVDGKRLSLDLVTDTMVTSMKLGEVISGQLKKIGVEAVLRHLDFATMVDNVFKAEPPNFDLWVHTSFWTGFDPVNLWNHLHSARLGPIPWSNNMGWSNQSLDDLLDQGFTEMDRDKRGELYSEAQKIILEQLPLFPLVMQEQFPAWTSNVHNIEETFGTQDGEWLDNVWIETSIFDQITLLEERIGALTNITYAAIGISGSAVVVALVSIYRAGKLRKSA